MLGLISNHHTAHAYKKDGTNTQSLVACQCKALKTWNLPTFYEPHSYHQREVWFK